MTAKIVTIIVVSALLMVFALQNAEMLQVDFLLWSFQTRRIVLIAVVLIAGILIGRLTAGWPRRKTPPPQA